MDDSLVDEGRLKVCKTSLPVVIYMQHRHCATCSAPYAINTSTKYIKLGRKLCTLRLLPSVHNNCHTLPNRVDCRLLRNSGVVP